MSSEAPEPGKTGPPGDDGAAGPDKVGEVTVRRLEDLENDLLVIRADFQHLYAAYLDHVRRWESDPDGLSQILMRQGLGAATLHLSCRPLGEMVGWTINIHQPPTNVFLTGDSSERTVTGRIYTENVKPSEQSRMFVQTTRNAGTPRQSVVEVDSHDVLQIFEDYYGRSEQRPARFFEVGDTDFLMLLGMPRVDVNWLKNLTRDEAIGLSEEDLTLLDEKTYRFQCGCSAEKMIAAVRGMFAGKSDDLFQGESGVEVFCPRCGRRWWLEREEFEGTGEEE
ncbi:MAG: hypothetical protein HKN12_08905 [Gemmatimonadetes bacterium]|nr:hypothetical protein [Gemmatimonadota bacterium]